MRKSLLGSVKQNNDNETLTPPCQGACPILTPVQRYISAIAEERVDDALAINLEVNPFPSICGRICCHPCEDRCRRIKVDEALSIASLKRFAADNGRVRTEKQKTVKSKKHKIAVIGAGPAGLAAANDLALLGYPVTVFEKMPEAGGMLRVGVPKYRLPKDVIQKEVKRIKSLGVEIKTNVEVGKDIKINDLKKEGYKAILIGVGLALSRSLPIEGVELKGVHLALPFLKAVNFDEKVKPGKKLIVIGGGNVAVDVARSARRLGAKDIKMICLESKDEMPAHCWEVEETLEEKVEIVNSLGPKRIIGKDGKVSGIEFMAVKSVFDDFGRFNPTFYKNKITKFECDTVIIAIGQMADLSFLNDPEIKLNERGQLIVNKNNFSTTKNGVFACGEVASGPGIAVEAIAAGKKTAISIDKYLRGEDISCLKFERPDSISELPEKTTELVKKYSRQKMPKIPIKERLKTFSELEIGFDKKIAVREALRCMSCGAGAEVNSDKCIACLTCVRVCPYEVPEIKDGFAYMDAEECQACGICASECPASAIEIRHYKESSPFCDKELLVKGRV
ncbi:MAG: FAD-dependent oxidoreductase [Actinobacteria bacterium]|nr:FAD-dependent oxidoreductase [Actinomycetota bacterium]